MFKSTRRLQLTPAAQQLLRVLAATSQSMPASRAFALASMRSVHLSFPSSTRTLACAAHELDRAGLVVHLRDGNGFVHLFATPRGRSWLAHLRSVDRQPVSVARTAVFTGIAAPVLMSCASVPQSLPPSVVPLATRAAQVEFDGRIAWAICATPDQCPGPTPKTRQVLIPTPVVAPPPATPPAPLPAVQPKFDSVSLFYRTGQADFPPSEKQTFDTALKLAKTAGGQPSFKVFVVGLTDPTGSSAVNAALSHRRAEVVRDLLAKGGIDKSRISTQADVSASRPVPPQATARELPHDKFSQFRRVDIVISARGAPLDQFIAPAKHEPALAVPAKPSATSNSQSVKVLSPPPPAAVSVLPPPVPSVAAFTSPPALNPRDIR